MNQNGDEKNRPVNNELQKMTPKRTLRAFCLMCVGGHRKEVEECDANDPAYHECPFHPYRLGSRRLPIKVFRQFCLQCMGGSSHMVKNCENHYCPMHPYRFGKNPARKGITGFFRKMP